jgi:hypothetical protein
MKNKDININISPNEGKKEPIYVQSIRWVTNTIANAKWTKILKVYFVTFFFLATALIGFYAFNVVKSEKFVDKSTEKILEDESVKKHEQEKKKEKIRTDVTPIIQENIDRIMYSLNADRVFIFECHNGVTNPSGLPFEFANMNYEVANRERSVDRVYKKYTDVPLTMYTFPNYMRKNKFFIGTMDDLSAIDYEFAKHMKEDGGKFCSFIYLSHGDGPLGFLGVSFHDMSRVPKHSEIENKVKAYGIAIATLLDLKKQQERILEEEKKILERAKKNGQSV